MSQEHEGKDPETSSGGNETEFVEVGVPNFYINNASITSTAMDVSIMLLERLDRKSATIKARTVMTPLYAKLFAKLLQAHIERWEKRWGEIQIPAPFQVVTSPSHDSDPPVSNEPEPLSSQSPTDVLE